MKRLIAKKQITSIGMLAVLSLSSASAFADYPEIYPFVPVETEVIYKRAQDSAEDENFIKNIFDMHANGLDRANTKTQPWTSTFWPLNKGLIADPYTTWVNPLLAHREVSWSPNYRRLTKRRKNLMKEWRKLSTKELNKLAPSEKYDLLIGDYTFDLSKRIVEYAKKWGSKKENSFLTSLNIIGGNSVQLAEQMVQNGQYDSIESALPVAMELRGGLAEEIAKNLVKKGKYQSIVSAMPEATRLASKRSGDYVLKPKPSIMALWEGICHGWSTAAGNVPRPRKPVDFRLENGKRLRFYPDDIKGLVSYLWANSLIQDAKWIDNNGNAQGGGIIMQGLRCNVKSPEKDEWGRYYDAKPDHYSQKLEPRCVGVHPALWHLALTNIIGKQGRSFIVERKVEAAVDNHPMKGYKSEFFNPYTGDYGTLANSVRPLRLADQFYDFRNPDTKMIVGVRLTMSYMDWTRPQREKYDSPSNDKIEDIEMLYDLELDADGNIVGGQWRTTEVGSASITGDRTQPDFFWVVTKDWKRFFPENTQISEWRNTKRQTPSDWKQAAFNAHSFVYQQTNAFGFNNRCEVVNKETDKVITVPCEHKIPKPQPLVNVVNKLIELSR